MILIKQQAERFRVGRMASHQQDVVECSRWATHRCSHGNPRKGQNFDAEGEYSEPYRGGVTRFDGELKDAQRPGRRRSRGGVTLLLVAHIVAIVLGIALVIFTVASAIKTVVVPRAAPSWITRRISRIMRKIFHWLAHPRHDYARRDRILAYFGPTTLIVLPGVWVFLSTVGFTGVVWGLGGVSWRNAFLTSGSSILTLGVVFQKDLPHATITFLEAIIGLGLVSLMISYLPTMYSSYSRREQLVALLEVRAGLPPSPGELLARYHRIGWLNNISEELFPLWEVWFADIEESHSSHPALVYFRSPHSQRNWVTAAGVVLDSAALILAVVDVPWSPRAALVIRSGSLSLRRISVTFRVPFDPDPAPDGQISISRQDFDELCLELEVAGVALKDDRDQAWIDFAGWRVNYDPVLIGLATLVVAPPARWSSDRTLASSAGNGNGKHNTGNTNQKRRQLSELFRHDRPR